MSNSLPYINNSYGVTVKQLKELLANWPEYNSEGDEAEVWIGANGLSSPVSYVFPLNQRIDDNGNPVADLILEAQ